MLEIHFLSYCQKKFLKWQMNQERFYMEKKQETNF